jgi:Na+/proline symporter
LAGALRKAADLDPATGLSKLHWLNAKFSLGQPFNIWMGIIGGTVMVMSSHGAEQLIVQRVLTCKTVADGRKALILSAVVIFPLFLIFLLAGVMLWVFYRSHAFQIPLPTVRPGSGVSANDFIFPIFMLTEVPHILRGFLIVAILSAAMSSVSSALTSLASVSTMDFVRPLWRNRSEEFFLHFSKFSTVLWAAALILVAYLSRQVEFVLNAAFSLRGLTSGALLGGLFLAVFWRRGGAVPVVVGMFASLGLMTAIQLLPRMTWTKPLWMKVVGSEIFWPWYTLIGTTATVTVAWLVRRLLAQKSEPAKSKTQNSNLKSEMDAETKSHQSR